MSTTSVGRLRRLSTPMPEDTAPDDTSSMRWPSACNSQTSATRAATGPSRKVPRSLVSVLEPIFTTTILPTRLPAIFEPLLELEGVALDIYVISRHCALGPQSCIHAKPVEPLPKIPYGF